MAMMAMKMMKMKMVVLSHLMIVLLTISGAATRRKMTVGGENWTNM